MGSVVLFGEEALDDFGGAGLKAGGADDEDAISDEGFASPAQVACASFSEDSRLEFGARVARVFARCECGEVVRGGDGEELGGAEADDDGGVVVGGIGSERPEALPGEVDGFGVGVVAVVAEGVCVVPGSVAAEHAACNEGVGERLIGFEAPGVHGDGGAGLCAQSMDEEFEGAVGLDGCDAGGFEAFAEGVDGRGAGGVEGERLLDGAGEPVHAEEVGWVGCGPGGIAGAPDAADAAAGEPAVGSGVDESAEELGGPVWLRRWGEHDEDPLGGVGCCVVGDDEAAGVEGPLADGPAGHGAGAVAGPVEGHLAGHGVEGGDGDAAVGLDVCGFEGGAVEGELDAGGGGDGGDGFGEGAVVDAGGEGGGFEFGEGGAAGVVDSVVGVALVAALDAVAEVGRGPRGEGAFGAAVVDLNSRGLDDPVGVWQVVFEPVAFVEGDQDERGIGDGFPAVLVEVAGVSGGEAQEDDGQAQECEAVAAFGASEAFGGGAPAALGAEEACGVVARVWGGAGHVVPAALAEGEEAECAVEAAGASEAWGGEGAAGFVGVEEAFEVVGEKGVEGEEQAQGDDAPGEHAEEEIEEEDGHGGEGTRRRGGGVASGGVWLGLFRGIAQLG